MNKRYVKHVLILCSAFLLNACVASALMLPAAQNIFLDEDVNLIEKNYAAADFLAGQARNRLNKTAPIVVMPLIHAQRSGMTSPFGMLVTEQVGSRFVQLGYNVIIPDKDKPIEAEDMRMKQGYRIGGTYFRSHQNADVNLRIMNQETGLVIAAFDYVVPINNEISELLQEQPTVFRVSEPPK